MIEKRDRAIERIARRVRKVPLLGPVARRVCYAPRDLRSLWHDYSRKRAFTVSAITRKNSREAYERLYRSPELLTEYLQDSRMNFFDEVVDVCLEAYFYSVLDAGCGTGHLLLKIGDRTEHRAALAGFDHATSGVEMARRIVPAADIRLGDICDPPFEGAFDLVVCTEVLEHVETPRVALSALAARCAPTGRLVVTVPDGSVDNWEGHVNFWSIDEFRAFLGEAGPSTVRFIDAGHTLLGVVRPYAMS